MKLVPRAINSHSAIVRQGSDEREPVRDAIHAQMALLVLRTFRELRLDTMAVARCMMVSHAQVARWTSTASIQTLNLMHLATAPNDVVFKLLTGLLESRSRNGHATWRLVTVDGDERHPEREQRATQLAAAMRTVEDSRRTLDAAIEDVKAIAAKMSGGQ